MNGGPYMYVYMFTVCMFMSVRINYYVYSSLNDWENVLYYGNKTCYNA